MQVLPINRGRDNLTFNAALKVTPAAKKTVYNSGSQNTIVSNIVFNRSMDKFRNMLYGEFPFAGDVFFDAISKKTKSANPHTRSKYEMRIMDKAVDFDFNHDRVFHYNDNRSLEEKIEQEANIQAGYLHNTYLYLRGTLGK